MVLEHDRRATTGCGGGVDGRGERGARVERVDAAVEGGIHAGVQGGVHADVGGRLGRGFGGGLGAALEQVAEASIRNSAMMSSTGLLLLVRAGVAGVGDREPLSGVRPATPDGVLAVMTTLGGAG